MRWCLRHRACCRTRSERRQYRRPQFSLTSQQEVAHLMGSKAVEPKLYLSFSLDAAVPANHIVRRLADAVDFGFVRNLTKQHYSHTGQPSVDPVVLFKLWLLGYLFNIRSERRLCEEAGLNLAWRWFLGYELDEALPDHSVLTKARRRFGTRVYELFFKRIVQLCEQRGLVQGDVLFIDSTLSDANAARDTLRSRALAGPRLPEPAQFVKDLFALNEPAPAPEPPRETGGIVPTLNQKRKGNNTGLFSIDDFTYLVDRDLYVCPAGTELVRAAEHFTLGKSVYRPKGKYTCAKCSLKAQCTTGRVNRQLQRSWGAEVSDRARLHVTSRLGQRRLQRRQVVSERIMADLKSKHGFERAQFRRRPSVQIQALLTAAVINLKQLVKRRPEAQSSTALNRVTGFTSHLCDAYSALQTLLRPGRGNLLATLTQTANPTPEAS